MNFDIHMDGSVRHLTGCLDIIKGREAVSLSVKRDGVGNIYADYLLKDGRHVIAKSSILSLMTFSENKMSLHDFLVSIDPEVLLTTIDNSKPTETSLDVISSKEEMEKTFDELEGTIPHKDFMDGIKKIYLEDFLGQSPFN